MAGNWNKHRQIRLLPKRVRHSAEDSGRGAKLGGRAERPMSRKMSQVELLSDREDAAPGCVWHSGLDEQV